MALGLGTALRVDARGTLNSLALSLWASRFAPSWRRHDGGWQSVDVSVFIELAVLAIYPLVPMHQLELGAEHIVTNAQHKTQNQGKVL